MEYDEKVIFEFASRLYKKARSIVVTYSFLGAIVGAGSGLALAQGAGAGFGFLIGLLIGYTIGTDRSFSLKLQAQTALCQLQIEKNTRAN